MEALASMDLGLLPPLESLDADDGSLVDLLTGDVFPESSAEFLQGEPSAWARSPGVLDVVTQPSIGSIDAALKQEPALLGGFAPVAPEPTPTTSAHVGQADGNTTDGAQQGGAKKRRRVRNSKQQELNRLAQQRYRQRKKEKYSELQGAVNGLQDSMQKLSVLEREAQTLRQEKGQLQQQVASRDAALVQAQLELRAQAAVLKQMQERCAAAEKQLVEQQQAVEQQKRLGVLPGGVDPQALSDRLLQVIRTALAEVSTQHSPAASALTSDAVVAQISRTLTSCCRELVYNNSHTAIVSKSAPPADTAAAIPVSCC